MDSSNLPSQPKPEEKKASVPAAAPLDLEAELQEFSRKTLTPAAKVTLTKYLDPNKVLSNLRFAPLICKDDDCQYKRHCPLHISGEPRPLQDPCPVEMRKMAQSVQAKILELNIPPDNYTDIDAVGEIAKLDVLIDRAHMELSDESISIENTVGIDAKGQALKVKAMNPALQALNNLVVLKSRKLKELEATRRAKREAGEIQGRTDALQLSNMDKLLKDAAVRDKAMKDKYIDARATVVDGDSPVEEVEVESVEADGE